MAKLVIVNDCAHVMENLIPVVSKVYTVEYLRRTRSPFSKTLNLAWKIMASKGDIYHVNYGLQDAYLVDKLKGHLDVLHLHGSDVRTTLKTAWLGWMVKSNMMNAKRVLYATEDMKEDVIRLRPDAIYLPTPVNVDVFGPKELYATKPKAVYFRLSYETLPLSVPRLLENAGISLDIFDKVIPYRDMPVLLKRYDVFIDRFSIPSLSKTALEAMSAGLATIDYRNKDAIEERIEFLGDPGNVRSEGELNREFVIKHHDHRVIGERLIEIYRSL
ncbi:MAG: hypothetical protein JRN32_00965 [Nitrososphaerota archaeon]|jgi:hypothetical protein|nr:hypothetical protein [Nitrososphaerota archaeon]MDG7037876.1 hypothetical protein [Nitrososphaerota archaeon]MDG7042779.1 hypothetical protein [Nitrososphaerota archaeon]MDG7045373.1 hypothetical protein [Nitrososphaerota archaeon]